MRSPGRRHSLGAGDRRTTLSAEVRRTMHRVYCSVGVALLFFGVVGAQAPTFDAASIKLTPALDDSPRVIIGPQPGGRWSAADSTVHDLLRALYAQYYFRAHTFGGPEWASRTRFEISATAQGNPSRETLNDMARELLKD